MKVQKRSKSRGPVRWSCLPAAREHSRVLRSSEAVSAKMSPRWSGSSVYRMRWVAVSPSVSGRCRSMRMTSSPPRDAQRMAASPPSATSGWKPWRYRNSSTRRRLASRSTKTSTRGLRELGLVVPAGGGSSPRAAGMAPPSASKRQSTNQRASTDFRGTRRDAQRFRFTAEQRQTALLLILDQSSPAGYVIPRSGIRAPLTARGGRCGGRRAPRPREARADRMLRRR